MKNIAVIILTHNGLEEATKPCVNSVLTSINSIDYTVVIVDNNSTDGTREYLTELSKSENKLQVILNDKNFGYAAGNNIGIKSINADGYILLNNDTLVFDYWIDNLISFLDNNADVGLVGPVTNSVGNEQMIYFNTTCEAEIVREGNRWASQNYNQYFYTDMLGFFCVAIRGELIESIGLLDEEYGLGSVEDDDYCYRARERGYKLVCTEGVFVYHKGSFTFNKVDKKYLEHLINSNITKYENKFGVKYTPKYDNAPFITLIEYYIENIKHNNIDNTVDKILNKLQIMKNFAYGQMCMDYTDLNKKFTHSNDMLAQAMVDLNNKQQHIYELQQSIIALNEELNSVYTSYIWRISINIHKIFVKIGIEPLISQILHKIKGRN